MYICVWKVSFYHNSGIGMRIRIIQISNYEQFYGRPLRRCQPELPPADTDFKNSLYSAVFPKYRMTHSWFVGLTSLAMTWMEYHDSMVYKPLWNLIIHQKFNNHIEYRFGEQLISTLSQEKVGLFTSSDRGERNFNLFLTKSLAAISVTV
jgi:hypothetical protein